MAILESSISIDTGEGSVFDLPDEVLKELGSPLELSEQLRASEKRKVESNSPIASVKRVSTETINAVDGAIDAVMLMMDKPSEGAIARLQVLIDRRRSDDPKEGDEPT